MGTNGGRHGSVNVCRLASMKLQNPVRRVATLIVATAMAGLLLPALVFAHAELDTPTPADKSTVTTPVTEVSGTFIQRMKVDGSTLVVKLVGGGTVAEGGVDPADDKRMVATPNSPLGSGSYLVEWTTNSAEDNEVARGTWTFTVAVAPSPSPTAAVSAAASAAPTVASATPPPSLVPTPVPSADGSSTGSGSDVILPIIVALIVLGAGAAYLLSRRNRPPDQL
jgi:methionine-rich copper-binding protein CopC